jgi:hypothetical protein
MDPFVRHWKALATVVAVVLAVLGLGGLPDDIRAWLGLGRWLRVNVPWWLLLLAALAVIAGTWAPTIWSRRGRRQQLQARAMEAEALQGKLVETEGNLSRLQREVDVVRSILTDARSELTEAKAGAENANRNAMHYHGIVYYGEGLREFPSQTDSHRQIAVSRLCELRPSLKAALAGANNIWEHLGGLAHQAGPSSSAYRLECSGGDCPRQRR